jgi:hypothetical protein
MKTAYESLVVKILRADRSPGRLSNRFEDSRVRHVRFEVFAVCLG